MRSVWANVAERVYETDVALGVSSHGTDRIGPEDLSAQRNPAKQPILPMTEENGECEEDYRHGWKPLSLSTPMLAAIIALTLLIAAAIETLAQRSKALGALAISPSAGAIPEYAKLGSHYLPIITAVIYSMIWSWVDLDAKRMQPWFQLSKSKATTVKDSLFLDYQYEFVGIVPWQSARRRHWPAFFAGTVMVLVLWAVTPFQSTIMGTGTIKRIKPATIGTRSSLVPMDQQRLLLGPADINTGYAVAWLNQPYPPFTTSDYALLPFYVQDDPSPTNVKSNWTATTTKFSSDLDCWLGKVLETRGVSDGRTFVTLSNGQGCNVSTTVYSVENETAKLSYMGYYYGTQDTYSFGTDACPPTKNSTHQFYAEWLGKKPATDSQPANITAMFCQPSYYTQKVLATVDSETLMPNTNSIQELEPRKLLSEIEFNSTAFEYVLSIGRTGLKGWDQPVTDPPSAQSAYQWPRLLDRGFSYYDLSIDNMVGFGMAATNLSVDSYSDSEIIHSAFKTAHQSLFVLALQSLLTNDTSFSNETASVEFYLHGIVVSRPFSAVVEGLLCLVAILTAALLWFCRTAPSKLSMNPSSISRYIDLFRNSPEFLDSFRYMDTASEKILKKKFGKDEVKMVYDDQGENTRFLLFEDARNSQDSHNSRDIQYSEHSEDQNEEQPQSPTGHYKPEQPLALRRESGAFFLIILLAAIIGLSYLKRQEKLLNGLPRPSNNLDVLRILENYIPTVFATLVQPFWLLLNRLLCVLQPFRDLSNGKAKASSSIDATYASIPPQLVFWRALKSKHFILMLLCVMTMLGNLLAIGLGSLFKEHAVTANYLESIHPAFTPQFISNATDWDRDNFFYKYSKKDHLYVTWANMSSGTTLPPWVSQKYFFQMYNFSDSSKTGNTHTFQTTGFGSNANCTAVGSFDVPTKAPPSSNKMCKVVEQAGIKIRSNMFTPDTFRNLSTGLSAVEYMSTGDLCDIPLAFGWGRTLQGSNSNATLEASLVTCYPFMEMAMFNVTVDSDGYIVSYNRASDLNSPYYAGSKNTTNLALSSLNAWVQSPNVGHNDTLARDWMNYFITLKMGSRDILDPRSSVPDSAKMATLIDEIHRQAFAIFLSQNQELFSNKTGEPVSAIRSSLETRIFMQEASFIITVVVLGLNIIVASIFYGRPTGFILPRPPTTLASVVAYIASSRLSSPTHKKIPGRDARTYSFGQFIGVDGKVHVGVEMDPHVVALDHTALVTKPVVFYRLRRFFTFSK